MAYMSSTTTAPNVPVMLVQGIAAYGTTDPTTQSGAPRTWYYRSTHISSDIEAVNFFTDGYYLGMRVNDLLMHVGSTTYIITSHTVLAVGATTTDLGTGSTQGLGS